MKPIYALIPIAITLALVILLSRLSLNNYSVAIFAWTIGVLGATFRDEILYHIRFKAYQREATELVEENIKLMVDGSEIMHENTVLKIRLRKIIPISGNVLAEGEASDN